MLSNAKCRDWHVLEVKGREGMSGTLERFAVRGRWAERKNCRARGPGEGSGNLPWSHPHPRADRAAQGFSPRIPRRSGGVLG